MRRVLAPRYLVPLAIAGALAIFAVTGIAAAPPEGSRLAAEGAATDATAGSLGEVAPSEAGMSGAGEAKAGTTAGDVAAAVPPAGFSAGRSLIRNGALSLLIERDSLLATLDRVSGMTRELDGYVVSSSLSGGSPDAPIGYDLAAPATGVQKEAPSGIQSSPNASASAQPTQARLTLRVPESRFETAMKRFSALGEVRNISTSSEDVTSQLVDLKARLRHHRAVERRLLRFLAASETIREMLVVQDRLDEVQLAIEQLEAQLKSLREVTAYSTLTLQLTEKGRPQAGQIDPSDTFIGVLLASLNVLVRGARLVALGFTAAIPFLVLFGGMGALTWFLIRRFRRRRHAGQSSMPA